MTENLSQLNVPVYQWRSHLNVTQSKKKENIFYSDELGEGEWKMKFLLNFANALFLKSKILNGCERRNFGK